MAISLPANRFPVNFLTFVPVNSREFLLNQAETNAYQYNDGSPNFKTGSISISKISRPFRSFHQRTQISCLTGITTVCTSELQILLDELRQITAELPVFESELDRTDFRDSLRPRVAKLLQTSSELEIYFQEFIESLQVRAEHRRFILLDYLRLTLAYFISLIRNYVLLLKGQLCCLI